MWRMRLPVENLGTKLVAYHTVVGADVHGWCVFDGRLDVDLLEKAAVRPTGSMCPLTICSLPQYPGHTAAGIRG